MTTGRINQVTIVRRGWPTGAAGGAGEMQVTGGRPLGARRAQRLRRVAGCAAGGNPLSPSSFPRASVRRAAAWLGRPGRRTQRAASTMAVSAARGCPLSLCGRTRQRPVAHRTHPAAVEGGAFHRIQASPGTP